MGNDFQLLTIVVKIFGKFLNPPLVTINTVNIFGKF